MAARLREGATGSNGSSSVALLPPSVSEATGRRDGGAAAAAAVAAGSAADNNGSSSGRLHHHHRGVSAHSHHSSSSSHAEVSNSGGGGGEVDGSQSETSAAATSYLAVVRRTGGGAPVSAAAAAEYTPLEKQPVPSASPSPSSNLAPCCTAAGAVPSDPVSPAPSASATAAAATTANTPSTPPRTLTAQEESAPTKLSRSAKRKRKLRAVKAAAAAAAAAAIAEAQAAGLPIPTPAAAAAAPRKMAAAMPDAGSSRNTAKQPSGAAAATSNVTPNTCGVSRRPGWHPSLAVASAMVSGESLAEMTASYASTKAASAGVLSSDGSIGATGVGYYAGPHMTSAATNATTTTTSSGASSACGSARHEPINTNAHLMLQQQQRQHNHGYNPYANGPLQQQMGYFNPMHHLTSPGPQQAMLSVPAPPGAETASNSSSGGGGVVGSGAAGTMLDPSTLAAATGTGTTTTVTTATRGGALHRGRGASLQALHGQANKSSSSPAAAAIGGDSSGGASSAAAAAAIAAPHPTCLSTSPGALLMQGGHLPTIRVGTAGTLVSPPMPGPHTGTSSGGRSPLAINNNSSSNGSSSTPSSHPESGGNAAGTTAFAGSSASVTGSSGVPRRHHHQHQSPVTFVPPNVNASHLHTSSSYSGSGSVAPVTTAATTTTATQGCSKGDLAAAEECVAGNSDDNTAANVDEYGEYTTQQQQQHVGEWSTLPLTSSTLHSANVGWSGSANAKGCGSNGSVAGGGKGKSSNGSHVMRTSSRGRASNTAAQMYSLTTNTNNNGALAAPIAGGGGGGSGGANTYHSFRNAGGSGGVGHGGRYGGTSPQQLQQSQDGNYANQTRYADQTDGGGMMNVSSPNMMGQATGGRRSAAAAHHNHNNRNSNNGMQAPMPYYDFITVLPTFVAACLTLQPEDEAAREQLCWTIEAVLRRNLTKNAEIRVHGSITTGLALPSSDVDVLVVGYQPTAPLDALQTLSKALIELDDASLKDALDFQESVERERLQQRLAEQQQKQKGEVVLGTADGGKETAVAAAHSQHSEQLHTSTRHSSSGTTTAHHSPDTAPTAAAKVEEKVETGECSVLSSINASPSTVERETAAAAAASVAVAAPSGIVVPVIAITHHHMPAAAAGEFPATAEAPSQRPSGLTLDGRKAFLTASANYYEEDDSAMSFVTGGGGGGADMSGQTERGRRGDGGASLSTIATAAAAATAAATATASSVGGNDGGGVGRSYCDLETMGAAEETEVYGTVDDVEQAEEVFRDQIEKDYSFSTTLDISTLFAPVVSSGDGVTPKMPSSPSPLNGPMPLPPPPPSLSSAHASATRDRAGAVTTTTPSLGGTTASGVHPSFAASFSPSSSSASTPSSAAGANVADDRPGEGATVRSKTHPEEEEGNRQQEGDGSSVGKAAVWAREHDEAGSSAAPLLEDAAAKTSSESATKAHQRDLSTAKSAEAQAASATPATAAITATTTTASAVVGPTAGRGGGHLTYVPVHDGRFFYVQAITATRVPVIKLTDKATGTKVDITFAGGEHWRSMQLTRSLLDIFPQARPLILFLKFCVRSLGVGESEPGGVTSFTIYLMVLHFYNECRKRVISTLEEREAASAAAAAAAMTTMSTTTAASHDAHCSVSNVGGGASKAYAAGADAKARTSHSTPLPQLSAQEEQQPSVQASVAASPASAFSTVLSAAAPTSTSGHAAAAAAAPLDLGLLDHFLGEYLARVEQRHAQMLEVAAAATAKGPDDSAETAASSTADVESAAAEIRTSSPVDEKGAKTQGRSGSVGACATIRAAYNGVDKAHLQTIRERILGFVGKPSAELTGVVASPVQEDNVNEHQQQQPSSSPAPPVLQGGGDVTSAAFSPGGAPLPQGVANVGSGNGDETNNNSNSSNNNNDGGDNRGRHAPPLHHYLMKTVEPQSHERNPANPAAAVTPTSRKEEVVDSSVEAKAAADPPQIAGSHLAEPVAAAAGQTQGGNRDAAVVAGDETFSAAVPRSEGDAAKSASVGAVGCTGPSEAASSLANAASAERVQHGNDVVEAARGSDPPAGDADAAVSQPSPPPPLPKLNSATPSKLTSAEAYDKFAVDFLQRQVNVSDLFLDFCHYYGCAFDYETCGIRFSMDGGSEVVKKPALCVRRGQHFHLTSPFDPEYDLTARMTHMRDFQWLCWWFTEWGAARQAPMYYGGCSLQYVLQCLSPQTAEADCQAVHQVFMAQALAAAQSAVRRNPESNGGGVDGFPTATQYPGQLSSQQQQQLYPAQQSGMDASGGVMMAMVQEQQQQQQQQQQPKCFYAPVPQQHYAAMSAYGQPMMPDPSYQQQQHQLSYAISPTDAGVGSHNVEGAGGATTATNAGPSPSPSTAAGSGVPGFPHDHSTGSSSHQHHSYYATESMQAEGPTGSRRHRPPLQHMQLPFVDSHEALEGVAAPGASASSPTTNEGAPTATTLGEEDNTTAADGEEEEEEDVPALDMTNDGTTTTTGSVREEEQIANSPLEVPNDEATAESYASQSTGGYEERRSSQCTTYQRRQQQQHQHQQQHDEEEDWEVGMEGVVGFDGTPDSDAAAMEAMAAMPYSDDDANANAQMQMYTNGYLMPNPQQTYRRPYGNEMGYYGMPQQQQQLPQQQQNQQAVDAAAFYYQAYANMNNTYAHHPRYPHHQQQQQPYDVSGGQSFYPASQAMLYPPQHMMYLPQQQQNAAATAATASNYPFPLLRYDVQQYLWIQEQQQQQQQLQNNEAARRTLSRDHEAETTSTSDITGSPAVMPSGAANGMQQQQHQQQQYYARYGMYPNVYNDGVWNRSASATVASGGGGGGNAAAQPDMQMMTRPYTRPAHASASQGERAAGGEASPQQQQQAAVGGHPRTTLRRQVSAHETQGTTSAAAAPTQQQQQHASHSRLPPKPHHRTPSSSAPPVRNADPTTVTTATTGKQNVRGDSCNDVTGEMQRSRRHVHPSMQTTTLEEQGRGQRSQQGTPVVISPSLSPMAVPRPRTQSLPPSVN
jgi:predicted nucleotidyltransferase